MDPVNLRLNAAEVGQGNCLAGMGVLVITDSQQPLSPIKIAARKEVEVLRRLDKKIEVSQIVGRIAKLVCRLQQDDRKDKQFGPASDVKGLPNRRHKEQHKGVNWQHMPLAQIQTGK